MPPRDSRTVSDVEAEKKRRARKRVKVKKAPRNVEPSHRDAPQPRFARGGDRPQEYADLAVPARHRNFVTGEVEHPVGLGAVGKAIGKATLGLAAQSAEGVPLTVGPRAPRGPKLSPEQRQNARLGLDTFLGPNLTSLLTGQGHVNPYWAVGEAALLPFGVSPLKSPTAVTALLRGARGVKEGVAARDLGVAAQEATRPILRVPPRVRSLGESRVPVAAARSRTGRAVERGIDKARPVLSRLPILKTPEQVWARDAERQITFQAKTEALPGVVADRKIKSLNRAQKYALYSMGTETSPEQWVRFYRQKLETAQDPLERAAIKVHIANFHKATRYVVEDGDSVALTGESSKKMQNAYDALQGSSEMRDQILTRGGYLDPDTIINRRSQPGRIARGAKYTPEEQHANDVVRNSPARQQLKETMESQGDLAPGYVDAQLSVLDRQARAVYEQAQRNGKAQADKIRARLDGLIENDDPDMALRGRLELVLNGLEKEIANTPYDLLYQHLANSGRGFPDAIKDAINAKYPGAQIHFKESQVDSLVQDLAKAMKGEELKRGPTQDNFTYFTENYGKTRGAYLADLPHEDRIREGFGRDIAPRGASLRPVDYENLAAEMIHQATGADTQFTHPLDELLSVRNWLQSQGIDPDELGATLRQKGEYLFKYDTPTVAYPAEKITARLKSKVNPRNAAKGLPTNPRIFRKVNGKRVQIAGPVSPQQWVKRVETVVPDKAERDKLARWYELAENTLRQAFGPDADKIMRGFAVSQANDSPSGGLAATLKVMEKLRKGQEITENEISVVVKGIETAVQDGTITKGVAAKLSDFIDSLVGKETRTWMGDLPEGGAPAAVDVHAIRDRGFIDQKQVARLEKQFGLKQGKDYVVDSTGGAKGPRYERISEWYGDIAKHLNDIKFDGRTDWTPAQAQALGWSVIQRVQGVTPEDLMAAVTRNTRSVDFEATQGPLGLGNDLTLDESKQVAEAMLPAAREIAENTPGIYVRDAYTGVGGWSGGTNASIHVPVVGTEEDVRALTVRVAQAFDQEMVQASRTISGKNSRAALVIHSSAFADDNQKVAFFKALNEADPSLEGFMSYDVNGTPGIAIRTTSRSVSTANAEQWGARYREAIEAAERSTGVDVDFTARNIELLIGGQTSGEVDALRRAGETGGLRELGDPDLARVRQQLTDTIEGVRNARGAGPEALASGTEGASRGKALQGAVFPPGVEGKQGDYFLHGIVSTPSVPPGTASKGLEGMRGHPSELYVSDRTHTPHETFTHELGHFWQNYTPKRTLDALKRAYGNDQESWVEAWMEYVLDKYPQRGLKGISPDLRKAFDTMSDSILKEAEQNGTSFVRAGMPREVAEAFDTMLWYRSLKGGQVRGAEHFTGGIYTAVERGFPVSLRHPLASVRHRLQALGGLFQGKTGVKKGFVDPSVKKHFTGRSVESGWIKIPSLGKASYNALLKAIRMDNVRAARVELLKASTDVPTAADDIAVFVNPAMRAPEQLKKFWETVQEMGEGMKVNELSLREVNELDDSLLEKIHLSAFPDQVDGEPTKRLAAEIIAGLREPIDGVRWVSSQAFHESELFSAPTAFYARQNNWGKLEALGTGVDTINDLMKLSVLPLNPAYAPMNLLGNLAMNLMQQGPFALINLPRAALLSRELDSSVSTAVDYFMGRGVMHLTETDRIAKHLSGTISHLMGTIVDMIPRRAAFLHEAYAMGYRSGDDIRALLSHPGLRNDLHEVVQRANDAIVDYERLSPFERKYLQRILFIYPWIKGATRYTFRFPAEHPIQAMGFAYLYERQQQAADEQLGQRPWYAEFDIPIGEVSRFGQEYPLVINPKQLLPFTTPYDVGTWLTGWFTGSDQTQSPVEALQPFWPALITSITGYDTFAQREVPRGPGTFLDQAMNFPLLSAIQNVGKTDAELQDSASNRLYPRNHADELLKAGLGSLAPTPYNAEKGQFYAEGKKGQTPEESARAKQEQIRGYYDPALQPKVDLALQTKVEFEHEKDAMRKRLHTDNLSDAQVAEALLDVAIRHTDGIDRAYVMGHLNAATAGKIRGALEKELGWNVVDAATTVANAKARDDEAKAEGAVAHAG